MNRTCNVLIACAVLAALCLTPTFTTAGDGCYPSSWLDRPAFGCGGSLYGLGYVPVPPYFAIHPPVYYGERYYRSYGESPFARPDYSSRPQRVRVEVIINPFVSQPAATSGPAASKPAEAKPSPDQVTVRPQIIMNPYYTPETKVASSE